MELNEQEVKQRYSDRLIGCFTIEHGYPHFVDLRSDEGVVVSEFYEPNNEVKAEYQGEDILVEHEFYEFCWHLVSPNPLVISIDGEVRPVDKVQLLTRRFQSYANLKGAPLESQIKSQDIILNEVTGAEHTYIYELLQNANDYPFEGEEVHVRFMLTPHFLFFLHTGAQFNLRNVIGLCSINQGEKRANRNAIGYKGIGFKTVFVNNDYVYLRSGDWQFRFDKAYSDKKCAGNSPWTIMPIPSSMDELDDELKGVFTSISDSYRVQFALRHKRDAKENIPQLEKVFSDDQILLFIPHVSKVEVFIGDEQKYLISKDQEKWVVNRLAYVVPNDLKEWVRTNISSGASKIPEKFKDISTIGISFAVSKEGNKLIPVKDARVYNYLPTELRLGFCFLINADFIPNGSRSGLHDDVKWNDVVMEECGRKFVEWWTGFLVNEGEWNMKSVFSLLPNFDSHNRYVACFADGFMESIKKQLCIPVSVDGVYSLCLVADIICDKIGLVSGKQPLLTDEEFYLFMGKDKFLAHKEIRNSVYLAELLEETLPNVCQEFDRNELLSLIYNDKFKQWLSVRENNIRFNRFVIENDLFSWLDGMPIFLDAEGTLKSIDKLYLDVDKYMGDIGFLSDMLPRLDSDVRKTLEISDKWILVKDKFQNFSDFRFSQYIIEHLQNINGRLQVRDNNVRLLHFIAKSGCNVNLKNVHYPLFTESGKLVDVYNNLWLKSPLGEEFIGNDWMDANWIDFVHLDYCNEDADLMRNFFASQGIAKLSAREVFLRFISNDECLDFIARKIQDKMSNLSFYRFLAQHFGSVTDYKFTKKMRSVLSVFATDGENEYLVPISDNVYFDCDEWRKAKQYSWMPKRVCLVLSSCYQTSDNEAFIDYFQALSLVFVFTQAAFGNMLRQEVFLSAIYANIKTKEDSCDFLNFLFVNKNVIFKDTDNVNTRYKEIPVKWDRQDYLASCKEMGNMTYYHTPDLDEFYSQKWIDKDSFHICDICYSVLFDGEERKKFYNQLGFKIFDKAEFFRHHVLAVIDRYKERLLDREANLSFHRYVCSISTSLSDDDFKKVKTVPIFLESSEIEEGIVASNSTNHKLPSDVLTEIVKLDIVPNDILDTIHHDYVSSEYERKYYENLDNAELDKSGFVEYLHDGYRDEVIEYLQNHERNIRFWRWMAHAELNKATKSQLSSFPLLGGKKSDGEITMCSASELFISNSYVDYDIESVVNQIEENPIFISDLYLEENESRENWIALFKAIGVSADMHDFVFQKVLPNLGGYRLKGIVPLLAEYEDEICSRLHWEENEEMRDQLSHLWLLCQDGNYRKPKDAKLSGAFINVSMQNVFPDIMIPNLVSEEYLAGYEGKFDVVGRVKRLLIDVLDCYENTLNLTALKREKLQYFLGHQNDYAAEEHFRIIGEMAQFYEEEKEDFKNVVKSHCILLYATDGVKYNSNELYLGSCYNPTCDFEGAGISTVRYLSEEYVKYIGHSVRKNFLGYFSIKEVFTEVHLSLLKNVEFAKYFWGTYAPKHEAELKNICTKEHLASLPCIPSPTGVKRPVDLYDYRDGLLQSVVNLLPEGKLKLPNVELPSWVGYIGFQGRLSLKDCLAYLLLDNPHYRRAVMQWIVETRDENIYRYQNEIVSYREKANWYSGQKKWQPLKSLVALEWGNDTLKDTFGANEYVCNPSYMPESKQDYERLCEILGIKVISNADFKKKKAGTWNADNGAKEEIKKRLLYLAYKVGGDWKAKYEEWVLKLTACDICSCSEIEYYYDENISANLMSFTEEDDKLWYVDSWNGMMYVKVLAWVSRVFELKRESSFLEILFCGDFNSYLKRNEVDLPQEFLDYLDEFTRQGLKVSSDESDMEWGHIESHRANLDDSMLGYEVEGVDRTQTIMDEEETFEANHEDDSYSDGSEANHSHERKERSDRGQHHASYERQRLDRGDEMPSVNVEYGDVVEDIQTKLQRKWEQKSNKELKRPHSSFHALEEMAHIDSPEPSASVKGDLFVEDNYSYSQQADSSSRTEQNLKRRNTEAKNAAEHADEQLQVNQLLQMTPKYSYLWFKYLMELVYSDQSSMGASQVQIDFHATELLSAERILRLSCPTKSIPNWITDSDNYQIIVYGESEAKVLRQGSLIYSDEKTLDVLVDGLGETEVALCRGAEMVCVKAEYSNNILGSLQTRFLQLGYDDDFNMQENLPLDIRFIYGPPGTGKTTRLAEIIHHLVEEHEDNLNILVMTPTNKAADVIAERLVEDDLCYKYLSRYGSTEDVSLIEHGVVASRDTMDLDDSEKNIVITTCARYSYDTMNKESDSVCDIDWDYIIMDEASMIDLVTITYILYKGEGSKFIIAGDPMQIRPVPRNDVDIENIYQMIGINELRTAMKEFTRYPLEVLTTQYRSVYPIGKLVSQFAYNGLLNTYSQRLQKKPLSLQGIPVDAINFVAFEVREFSQLYELGVVGKSPLHLYSAIFTYNMVGYVAKQICLMHPSIHYSIGIVSPYKGEADAINQMLEARPIDQPNCMVKCGTVHSFQGDECDIMFVVLNPPVNSYSGSHVNNQNIVNVAMSRARDYLFFVIPEGQLDGYHIKNILGKILKTSDKTIMYCRQLEKVIFGKEYYIEENTEVTCHMPVNVYYNSQKEYDVRWDDNAIDIQINGK